MSELELLAIPELLTELGERMRQLRLSRGLDQRALAERARLSERALRNLEMGRGSTLETWLRALRALEALDTLERLLPPPFVNPLLLLRTAKTPRRVRRPRKTP